MTDKLSAEGKASAPWVLNSSCVACLKILGTLDSSEWKACQLLGSAQFKSIPESGIFENSWNFEFSFVFGLLICFHLATVRDFNSVKALL